MNSLDFVASESSAYELLHQLGLDTCRTTIRVLLLLLPYPQLPVDEVARLAKSSFLSSRSQASS